MYEIRTLHVFKANSEICWAHFNSCPRLPIKLHPPCGVIVGMLAPLWSLSRCPLPSDASTCFHLIGIGKQVVHVIKSVTTHLVYEAYYEVRT